MSAPVPDVPAVTSPAVAIVGSVILEEWRKQWTPTLEDAVRVGDRVLAVLVDRCVVGRRPALHARSAVSAILFEEWRRQWTPTVEDAERAAARVVELVTAWGRGRVS